MGDPIATWEAEWPDINAPSENTIDCGPFTDVPNIDLFQMLTQGTRTWDEQSGSIYERLLQMPTDQLNRYYDKIWRLTCLHHYAKCPEDLLDYLLWMVGFGPIQGAATDLAELLDSDQKRLLIKIAVKLWKRRGRLDLLAEAIRLFASRVKPRMITWFWRAPRVDDIIVGSMDNPNTDLELLYTEHFSDGTITAANRTLIRCFDDGSTNRDIVEALAELNRPSHEYFEIAYVDFVDTFNDGRLGFWETAAAPAATLQAGDGTTDPVVMPAMVLVPGAAERVVTDTSSTWHDYIVKVVLNASVSNSAFAIKFYVQDANNCYLVGLDYSSGGVVLAKTVAGVTTPLDGDFVSIIPLEPYGIVVDVVERQDGDLKIRVYVDENLVIDSLIASPQFTEGTVEFENDPASSGNMSMSYPEVFQRPLDVTVLGPP